MMLIPKSFKYKNGTSGRTHFGFIAQDVEDALSSCGLTSLDFAGFCKDIKTKPEYDDKNSYIGEKEVIDENGNPEYIYSLRYTEFISLITHMVQKLYKEKTLIYEEIESIKLRISLIENKI